MSSASGSKEFAFPLAAELFYDLAALAIVATLAYFFFWGFVILVGPMLLVSIILMIVESRIT